MTKGIILVLVGLLGLAWLVVAEQNIGAARNAAVVCALISVAIAVLVNWGMSDGR